MTSNRINTPLFGGSEKTHKFGLGKVDECVRTVLIAANGVALPSALPPGFELTVLRNLPSTSPPAAAATPPVAAIAPSDLAHYRAVFVAAEPERGRGIGQQMARAVLAKVP